MEKINYKVKNSQTVYDIVLDVYGSIDQNLVDQLVQDNIDIIYQEGVFVDKGTVLSLRPPDNDTIEIIERDLVWLE